MKAFGTVTTIKLVRSTVRASHGSKHVRSSVFDAFYTALVGFHHRSFDISLSKIVLQTFPIISFLLCLFSQLETECSGCSSSIMTRGSVSSDPTLSHFSSKVRKSLLETASVLFGGKGGRLYDSTMFFQESFPVEE